MYDIKEAMDCESPLTHETSFPQGTYCLHKIIYSISKDLFQNPVDLFLMPGLMIKHLFIVSDKKTLVEILTRTINYHYNFNKSLQKFQIR